DPAFRRARHRRHAIRAPHCREHSGVFARGSPGRALSRQTGAGIRPGVLSQSSGEKYEDGNIPAAAHVLVAAQGMQTQAAELMPGRRVSYLTSIPAQKLDLYWVGK